MYEKLSDKLERVVQHAEQIAREYGQECIDTEHLLLGIFREGTGGAVQLLQSGGATLERVKSSVDAVASKPRADDIVMGHLPASPHYKNVIARAIEEARALKTKVVCTEHLLLALLREKGSAAQAALANLGVREATIRNAMTDDAA